jgi:hypothetical protein
MFMIFLRMNSHIAKDIPMRMTIDPTTIPAISNGFTVSPLVGGVIRISYKGTTLTYSYAESSIN